MVKRKSLDSPWFCSWFCGFAVLRFRKLSGKVVEHEHKTRHSSKNEGCKNINEQIQFEIGLLKLKYS